jgi:predicted RNA-binding protein with RPS1 domain
MGDQVAAPLRGRSHTAMRVAVCKDCQREIEALEREIADAEPKEAEKLRRELQGRSASFTYPENDAVRKLDRGGSRSDRCSRHRQEHGSHIQGMAVAYVDLTTVGEVADRENPTGPLGGLGPLPGSHDPEPVEASLATFEFGMNDQDIVEILELLRDHQVLVLKAGTGTGKSTFGPYRLMDPPTEEDCEELGIAVPERGIYRLTDAGQIIVTEPRVAAATGVATFVGTRLSGTGVGPGYPVGYQVSGDRNHDDACQLVFVTDGTMINWLREGRLSRIGTVIVDEAHERSTNIDFIMGYLRRDLGKYPHLRVIITSATFNTDFYLEYFGGPEVVAVKEIPAVKSVGYGMPLFPGLDTPTEREQSFFAGDGWGDDLWPVVDDPAVDERRFLKTHWPTRLAPPLKETEVVDTRPVADGGDLGFEEDLHATTEKLLPLRFEGFVAKEDWKTQMPDVLADFVIDLARSLDDEGIFGDILGFLPTGKTIEHACEKIRAAIGDRADVFALLSSLKDKEKEDALSARKKGEKRKIVISTNLAETSLTVEGVRFVVDSGLIAQSEWDPELAVGGIPTKPHSQAGIKQRWGRVGRKAPGWVFPLYTKEQFAQLDEDTPPGSARENLEALMMTARLGGIDDVKDFPWPAAFDPTTTQLDPAGEAARKIFLQELDRADLALRGGGAVDDDGHPTAFGREVSRLSGFGSTAAAMSILYADRLACVPEVVTILTLLEGERLIGQKGLLVDDYDWPAEWRLEAARRHRGLAGVAEDDAHLALLVAAAWERAEPDPKVPPWQESEARRAWARRWWVSDEVLLAAANRRKEALASLSPAMKEEVKRFVEPALLDRARGVIGRTMGALAYRRDGEGSYIPVEAQGEAAVPHALERDTLTHRDHPLVVGLRRRDAEGERFISNLVAVPEAAEEGYATGVRDAMQLILDFRRSAPVDPGRNAALALMERYPVGTRLRFAANGDDGVDTPVEAVDPSERPPTAAELEQGGPARRRKRRRRRFDAEETDGTQADFRGEIQAVERQGVDDEAVEERRFADADARSGDAVPCGACVYCRSGREADCREKMFVSGHGRSLDALAGWMREKEDPLGGATIELRSDEPKVEGEWYEVTGYESGDDRPQVGLALCRSATAVDEEDLGEHDELVAGRAVEVEVGEIDSTHSGEVRVFYRVDGGGRCVVAEAGIGAQDRHGAIGMSLDRSAFGLLKSLEPGARLAATAVPAGAKGQMTITLLETLRGHLRKAEGSPAEPLLEPTRGRGPREPWAIGKVADPDARGKVLVELALVDKAAGVRHLFKLGGGQLEGADDDEGAPALAEGHPVRLRLRQKSVPLPVGGVSLEGLAKVLKQADRQLVFKGEPETQKLIRDLERQKKLAAGDDDDAVADLDEDVPRAGPDDRIATQADTPVHRSIAELLAGLDESPSWQRDVWAFWARSHHLRPVESAPAEEFTEVDVAIGTVKRTDETPLEQRRGRFDAWAEEHPVGSRLVGRVKKIAGSEVFVELEPGIDVKIPPGELRWGDRKDDPADHVGLDEEIELELIAIRPDDLQLLGSSRALEPDPAPGFIAAHPPGTTVEATVKSLPESGNVWVGLVPGFDVQLSKREISWEAGVTAAELLEVGEEVRLKVLAADPGERTMTLSLRGLQPSPCERFVADHPLGSHLTATVDKLVSEGRLAIVDVGFGIEARLPISEASFDRLDSLEQVVSIGEQVDVEVTGVDVEKGRITVSAKRRLADPWSQIVAAPPIGESMVGRVTKLIPAFVFLDLGRGLGGAIHVRNLAARRIEHPSEVVQEGELIEVRVLSLDMQRKRLDLAYVGPHAGRSMPPPRRIGRKPADPEPAVQKPAQGEPVVQKPVEREVRSRAKAPRTRSRPAPRLRPSPAPRIVESEGSSVEDAVRNGLRELGLFDASEVRVEVVQEPLKGFLGRLKKPARVRLHPARPPR